MMRVRQLLCLLVSFNVDATQTVGAHAYGDRRELFFSSSPATYCCSNEFYSCFYTSDGICDDGGPGSDFSACPFGADCLDCGDRCAPTPPPTPPSFPSPPSPPPACCENSCGSWFTSSGECDDGGDGASQSYCDFGTGVLALLKGIPQGHRTAPHNPTLLRAAQHLRHPTIPIPIPIPILSHPIPSHPIPSHPIHSYRSTPQHILSQVTLPRPTPSIPSHPTTRV